MKKTPRPYQDAAIKAVFHWFSVGNNGHPLIVAPVASGKSLICAEMIKRIHESAPRTKIVVLTHVQELLIQNADELRLHYPECDFGFYCAGLGEKKLHNDVTFASIQSVHSKALDFPRAVQIIIVDEAHLIPHKSDTQYRKFIDDCIAVNPQCKVIGLTGTPFRSDSGRLEDGDNKLFDGIAYDIGIDFMIKNGFLCKPIVPKVNTVMSVEGVKTRNGDYIESQLQKAVDVDETTKACVDEIIEHGKTRKKWLVFTAGIQHCEHVRDEIRSRGVSCEMVTGETPKAERDDIIRRYRNGDIKCLVNVAVLCLDSETEILTKNGFVGIDEMNYDHDVAAWKFDGSIEFCKPLNIVRREIEDDEYFISANGISANFKVTSNHRMVIKCGFENKKNKVVSAKELVGKRFKVPSFGNCEPEKIFIDTPKNKQNDKTRIRSTSFNLRKRGYDKKTALDMAIKQVERLSSLRYLNPHELSLDDCKLIGFWLGDGTKSNGRVAVCQSTRYKDNIEWFDEVLKNTGINHSRNIRKKRIGVPNDTVIWTLARGTGGYGQSVEKGYFYLTPYLEKDGSQLFYHFNKKQLESLLEGFWRADGIHHAKKKLLTITGTQKKLYDKLQSLCVMRGISASISKEIKPRKSNHKPQWSFSWKGRENWCYVPSSTKIEPSKSGERVWCITSSTSFLICRRKGKVFITGNTTGFNVPDIDMLAFMRPTRSPVLYIQCIGRGLRTAIGKSDCLVLDFGGIVQNLGPIDAINITKKHIEKNEAEKKLQAILKICPGCGAECAAAQKYCYICSHCFVSTSLDMKASNKAILTEDEEPEWYDVIHVSYSKHIKKNAPDAPPTMRVTYTTMTSEVSEWICFEHEEGSFANNKAIDWHFERSQAECPSTVDDALKVNYNSPSKILLKRNGRFYEVVKCDMTQLDAYSDCEEIAF